jgi:hypothetical protein
MTTESTFVERKGESGVAGSQRVRWGAVFAGVIIAIVTQMLLTVLGLAVGFTAFDPRQGVPGAGFGWGAAIWAIVSLLVSLFIGAWLAGRLSGAARAADGALNGILVWALSLLLMIYMVGTGVGSLVSGAFAIAGGVAQTAGTIVGPQGAPPDRSGQDVTAQAREAAREARETMERLGQSGTAEGQQARETAARATGYAAAGAWSFLIGALLGLGVAWWGGLLGARATGRPAGTVKA